MKKSWKLLSRCIGSAQRASDRYSQILCRCGNREYYKNIKVLVSRDEFMPWFMARDFKGASVDRINNRGHYKLDNMQVISVNDNARKDKIKNFDNGRKCSKCKIFKSREYFHKSKTRSSGLQDACKLCKKERSRIYHQKRKLRLLQENKEPE